MIKWDENRMCDDRYLNCKLNRNLKFIKKSIKTNIKTCIKMHKYI